MDLSHISLKLTAVLLPLVLWANFVNAEDIAGVGIKRLEVVDPVDQRLLEAVAFFPSSVQSGTTSIGPYEISASRSAPVRDGSYPLILLSHGNLGSMWDHHDLATALVQRGFVVVSVTHPGDNFLDESRIGATSNIYGRPLQMSAALSAAFKDPVLAAHIDTGRIGFVGFSAGGTTGLILAGGRPTLSRLEDYCARRLNDHHVCEGHGHTRVDRADLKAGADPRIRAFVLLAPLSVVFSSQQLQPIKAPLLVLVGDKDEELSPSDNAIALVRDMQPSAGLQVVPGAGHFTFLAPCSVELNQAMPELCIDGEGVDRVALHRRINSDIGAFFDKTLEGANP